jgi:hypothetical protein
MQTNSASDRQAIEDRATLYAPCIRDAVAAHTTRPYDPARRYGERDTGTVLSKPATPCPGWPDDHPYLLLLNTDRRAICLIANTGHDYELPQPKAQPAPKKRKLEARVQ